MTKRMNVILWSVVVLLSISFVLSFINSSENKRTKSEKTALLNPKYKETITHFVLFDSSNAVELKLTDGIWTVNYPSLSENKIPADQKQIKNLIEKLCTIRNLYKISDNSKDLANFELNTENSFHIIYYKDNTSSDYTDLIFGKHDFSQNYRYFKTETSEKIYEITTDLDALLNSKIQSWTEGLIISKNLINADIQKINFQDYVENQTKNLNPKDENFKTYTDKLFELRQGGIPDHDQENNECLSRFRIFFGNLDELELEVYADNNENEFLLKEKYTINSNNKKIEYTSKISSWTYEKLKF